MEPVNLQEKCYVCRVEIEKEEEYVFAHARYDMPPSLKRIDQLASKLPERIGNCIKWLITPNLSYQRYSEDFSADPMHIECIYQQIKNSAEGKQTQCGGCRRQMRLSPEILNLTLEKGDGTPEWQLKKDDDPDKVAWKKLLIRLEPSLGSRSERICILAARIFSITTVFLCSTLLLAFYLKGLWIVVNSLSMSRFLYLCARTNGAVLVFPVVPPLLLFIVSKKIEWHLYLKTLKTLNYLCTVPDKIREHSVTIRACMNSRLLHAQDSCKHLIQVLSPARR